MATLLHRESVDVLTVPAAQARRLQRFSTDVLVAYEQSKIEAMQNGSATSVSNVGTTHESKVEGTATSLSNVTKKPFPNKPDYTAIVKRDLPRAYWEFEEAAGATTFVDSLNGGSLAATGAVTAGAVGGLTNPASKAVTNFASDRYLTWPLQPAISGNWTVECLFNLGGTAPVNCGLIGSRGGGTDASFSLFVNGSNIHLDIGNGSAWLVQVVVAAPLLSIVEWHHLAVTATPTGWKLYLDADLIGSGTFSGTPLLTDATHLLRVGHIGALYPGYFMHAAGRIDEAAIYDKALAESRFLARTVVAVAAAEQEVINKFTGWGVPL